MLTLLALNHAPPLKPFVPRDFNVPRSLAVSGLRLQALTMDHAEADFEALITSSEHLQALFGSGWPRGLTPEQHRIDLAWHQKEFERRTSFAYAVLAGSGNDILGCAYVSPSDRSAFDAEVRYWVRRRELDSGLQERLGVIIADWMEDVWPFINPRYRPSLRPPKARLH
ncbi:MAG: GNAT family N-acetyltransferase [Chromatocurvus sp.]